MTEDYETLNFNTAIAQMMIFVNACYKENKIYKGFIEGLVLLLSPIAPHICEEMWEYLGHDKTLAYEPWPTFDESLTKDDLIEYPVSVNGKMRDKLYASAETSKEELEKLALDLPKIKAYTDGKTIVKMIVVPKKIINIVVK